MIPAAPVPAVAPVPSTSNPLNKKIIGGCVLLVVLLALYYFFVYKKKKGFSVYLTCNVGILSFNTQV